VSKRQAILLVMIGCGGQDAAPAQQPNDVTTASTASAPTANAPTASVSATSIPTANVSAVKLPADAQAILDAHNRLRAQHCAAPLTWSDDIAHAAKAWVDHLAARGCNLQHSQTNYGENIAGGSASTQSPDRVVDLWYREHDAYDFARGGFSMRSGHFTQVVWRGSQKLGCASASCGDIRLTVCNYDPPGNMQGDFQRNVLPTSCKK
jgi:hypothetical protein